MYLPELATDICQGDIFDAIPFPFISLDNEAREPEAKLRVVRAMMLNHSCDFDKPTDVVIMAEVKAIGSIPNGGIQGHIRSGRIRTSLYLPELPQVFAESFVDFNNVGLISKELIRIASEHGNRIASLDRAGTELLWKRVTLFIGPRPEDFPIAGQ